MAPCRNSAANMNSVKDTSNDSTFSEFEENAISWFSSASSDQKFHFMLKLSGYMDDDELMRLVPKLREVNPPSPCMVPKTKVAPEKISPVGRRNIQAQLDEVKPSSSRTDANEAPIFDPGLTNGFATAGGKSIAVSQAGMSRAKTFIQSIENTGSLEKVTLTNGFESTPGHRTSPLQSARASSDYENPEDSTNSAVDQKSQLLTSRKPASIVAPPPKSKPFKPPGRLQPSKRTLVDSCESNIRKSPKLSPDTAQKPIESMDLLISESQEILSLSLALLEDDCDDF